MEPTTGKKLLQRIHDDDISALLHESQDLSFHFSALAELLRDAENLDDVTDYEEEIDETIVVFLRKLIGVLPREISGFYDYVFNLLDNHDARIDCPKEVEEPIPTWPWPLVETKDLSSSKSFLSGGFREQSALKFFGYTVGKTNGWPKKKRQEFLSDFIEMELPAIVEKTFPNEYGEPNSTTRLRAVACFLANIASLAIRRNPIANRYAVDDWTSDLNFLRVKYYEGRGLKFQPWPEVEKV